MHGHDANHASAGRRPASCASVVLAVIVLTGVAAHGEQSPGVSAASGQAAAAEHPPTNPFDAGATGIEFGVGLLNEAWNLNERHEWLVEGAASFWWAFKQGLAVGVEFRHARVFQDTPDAFVQGLSPLVRWQFLERNAWRLYAEVGPGISWSDRPVPLRGTKFNYLFQGGTGVMRRLGRNSHAVAAFRFLHLSNNGREGIDRNPDIEALGAYLGLAVSF